MSTDCLFERCMCARACERERRRLLAFCCGVQLHGCAGAWVCRLRHEAKVVNGPSAPPLAQWLRPGRCNQGTCPPSPVLQGPQHDLVPALTDGEVQRPQQPRRAADGGAQRLHLGAGARPRGDEGMRGRRQAHESTKHAPARVHAHAHTSTPNRTRVEQTCLTGMWKLLRLRPIKSRGAYTRRPHSVPAGGYPGAWGHAGACMRCKLSHTGPPSPPHETNEPLATHLGKARSRPA